MSVTIIAALEIIAGLFYLLGGVSFVALAPYFATYGEMYTAISGVASGVFIVLAIITFVIAWGLLTGKNWARWIGIIVSALGVLSGLAILPMGIVFVVIDGAIIYYLTRPNVVNWFSGRAPAEVSPPPPPPPV
jgi:hypothetical protein